VADAIYATLPPQVWGAPRHRARSPAIDCGELRERKYLDCLYRRPVGSTDPDNDPGSLRRLMPVYIID
jgi:hypothetical protein